MLILLTYHALIDMLFYLIVLKKIDMMHYILLQIDPMKLDHQRYPAWPTCGAVVEFVVHSGEFRWYQSTFEEQLTLVH